jgi:type IX secretion system PorP/SprF family membrane protein
MRNNILTSIILLMQLSTFVAQEIQFTQFYAAPQFLNPAFTGLTYEHRFTANYRNQWPGIKRAFTTSMAAYDYNISNLNSGIGGFVIYDRAGTSNLLTQQQGLNFAYRFKVNKYSELRLGMVMAMSQKRLDYTNLIFNDQLAAGSGSGSSKDALAIEKINYLDVGCGALFNTTNYWIGVVAELSLAAGEGASRRFCIQNIGPLAR